MLPDDYTPFDAGGHLKCGDCDSVARYELLSAVGHRTYACPSHYAEAPMEWVASKPLY